MGEAYLLIVLTALGCLIFEKATKKRLSTAQWDYTRDAVSYTHLDVYKRQPSTDRVRKKV